jgi:hypothetical protein
MVGYILFVLTFSKSANYLGIFWEFWGNSLEHVGLSVLYMLGFTVGIFYMTQIMDMRRY